MKQIGQTVQMLKRNLAEGQMTPLREILTDADVEAACHAVGHTWRERIFTPLVTLWGFIGQSLSADASCRAAVTRILAGQAFPDGEAPSEDSGAFCKARKRLPERMIEHLALEVADRLEEQVPPERLWRGRRVRLLDGTCVSMPDTPALADAFGLPPNTKPGVGFPVARLAGLLSWSTGAVVDAAMDAYTVHERHLAKDLWKSLHPGDVLVGDAGFGSYAEIALLRAQGIDCVFRVSGKRHVDFRRGVRLGEGDHIVTWKRPAVLPDWLPEDIELPEQITVREIRFQVEIPGCRAEEIVLVTTLTDATAFPKEAIAELFAARWEVELDLRHIKTTMQMDILRGQSPDIVRKEVWTHLLAYNLIRSLMWEASQKKSVPALRISFKGSIQRVLAWTGPMARASLCDLPMLYQRLLDTVAADLVPHRPFRFEPRCRKRRPKNYPLLTVPRHIARQHLLDIAS